MKVFVNDCAGCGKSHDTDLATIPITTRELYTTSQPENEYPFWFPCHESGKIVYVRQLVNDSYCKPC